MRAKLPLLLQWDEPAQVTSHLRRCTHSALTSGHTSRLYCALTSQPTRGLFDAMVRCDLYPIEPSILSDMLHHSPGTVVLDQARHGK